MIDRVLCALLFKDTAFGLTRANHPLSLQLFFTLRLIPRLDLTDQIRLSFLLSYNAFRCSQCVLSVDWKNTSCNSDYERFVLLFCYFFSSVDCCAFLRSLSREYVHDESIYGFEESLVYRWFFSLFLFLPSRLYSRGFTRWHDATRHWLLLFHLRVRISNF